MPNQSKTSLLNQQIIQAHTSNMRWQKTACIWCVHVGMMRKQSRLADSLSHSFDVTTVTSISLQGLVLDFGGLWAERPHPLLCPWAAAHVHLPASASYFTHSKALSLSAVTTTSTVCIFLPKWCWVVGIAKVPLLWSLGMPMLWAFNTSQCMQLWQQLTKHSQTSSGRVWVQASEEISDEAVSKSGPVQKPCALADGPHRVCWCQPSSKKQSYSGG